jgi:hypothetical protein
MSSAADTAEDPANNRRINTMPILLTVVFLLFIMEIGACDLESQTSSRKVGRNP